MPVIDIEHISKSFGKTKVLDDISLTVEKGEFFGLLGPNGAGKTTTIRILLDLFKADQGKVSILGGPITEEKKNRIGYMPEERGLYVDQRLEHVLVYLAELKGMTRTEIGPRLNEFLERFDLTKHRKKKIRELSKGMQQKAQIISTIIHQPDLLIIDEPFSGLDPVNTQMVKDILWDLHLKGSTIIMSTHQMNQVEELCERILLIDHGKTMLYGNLNSIRKQFTGDAVLLRTQAALPTLPGVQTTARQNGTYRLELEPNRTPQSVLESLVAQGMLIEHFEIAIPTLDEIFIRVVSNAKEANQ